MSYNHFPQFILDHCRNKIPVEIDGKVYESLKDAANAMGVSSGQLRDSIRKFGQIKGLKAKILPKRKPMRKRYVKKEMPSEKC